LAVLIVDLGELKSWKEMNYEEAQRIRGRFKFNFQREFLGEIKIHERISENRLVFSEESARGTPLEILKGLANEAQDEAQQELARA